MLRYDKRGTGASTGSYDQGHHRWTSPTIVQAGVAYLKTRKDIDPRHVGLVGHSEGGLIVPWDRRRARSVSTAFMVMHGRAGRERLPMSGWSSCG